MFRFLYLLFTIPKLGNLIYIQIFADPEDGRALSAYLLSYQFNSLEQAYDQVTAQ